MTFPFGFHFSGSHPVHVNVYGNALTINIFLFHSLPLFHFSPRAIFNTRYCSQQPATQYEHQHNVDLFWLKFDFMYDAFSVKLIRVIRCSLFNSGCKYVFRQQGIQIKC